MTKKLKKLVIKKDPENEIAVEVMEKSIIEIADAWKKVSASRVSRHMLVALIKDKSGLTKGTIEVVLNNLDSLEANWLRKK